MGNGMVHIAQIIGDTNLDFALIYGNTHLDIVGNTHLDIALIDGNTDLDIALINYNTHLDIALINGNTDLDIALIALLSSGSSSLPGLMLMVW